MKTEIKKIIGKIYQMKIRWYGNKINLKRAVKKANKISSKNNGKKYYVFFIDGKYRIWNRKDIQRLKRKKVLKQHLNVDKMKKICLYQTSTNEYYHCGDSHKFPLRKGGRGIDLFN